MDFPKGTDGKEFVAARDTAVGGHPEKTLERCQEAGDVLWGDALEVVIAADRTMRGKAVGEWDRAATKAYSAVRAPPGQATDQGSGEIH